MTLHDSVRRHPAGERLPESVEVRAHREDAEAVRLANSHRVPAREDDRKQAFLDTLAVFGGTAYFAVLLVLIAAIADVAGVL